MSKISKSIASCIVLAAVGSQLTLADEGQFYIAPGIQFKNFDNSLNLDDDTGWFMGLGYDFTDRISGEISAFDVDPKQQSGSRVDLDHYKVDLLWDITPADTFIDPFLITGFGNTNTGGDNDSLWDIGAGVQVRITDNLSWRTSVRNYYYLGRDFEDNDLGIDTALVWRFGGGNDRSSSPVVAAPEPAPAPAPPPVVDTDGDGVPDNRDQCADTPVIYAVDANGCQIPVEEVASVELEVLFPLNVAVVPADYYSEIQDVADFMDLYPDVQVELEGHTDSTGEADYNQDLSQRRADAVRQVLIDEYNIRPARITAVGHGETMPIANNNTADGRAENRRVMAVISKTIEDFRPR